MNRVFSEQDRLEVFEYILSVARQCEKAVSLVQIGSGAIGYHDARSDLDYVIALDADDSMPEVMEYMHMKIAEKYQVIFFSQEPARHLQSYILSDMLEIDIGYGGYMHAAARKPAFRVLYDRTGVVEEKMVQSLQWMEDSIYGDQQKKDIESACTSVWLRLMHAAVAIHRGNTLRAIGELDQVRKMYVSLLGDRHRLESALYRELDRLPEEEKAALRSTFVTSENPETLWTCLMNLTDLVYAELEGQPVGVTKEMLLSYYEGLR